MFQNVSIEPNADVEVGDVLTCTPDFTDINNDLLNYTYEWTDASNNILSNANVLTLTPTMLLYLKSSRARLMLMTVLEVLTQDLIPYPRVKYTAIH